MASSPTHDLAETRGSVFLIPASSPRAPADLWPDNLPRDVGPTYERLSVGLDRCAAGVGLGCFPRSAAQRDGRLVEVASLPNGLVWALRRPALVDGDKAAVALDAWTAVA